MNAQPTWDELRREYESDTIGPHWLSEITRAVEQTARKYPPATYSETGAWSPASLENLVQEVVLTQLLEEGQLDYILTVAAEITVARALIARVVRRTLARGRRRTVVDNLLERAHAIVPFAPPEHPAPPASNSALVAAASRVAALPRVRIISSDRAPTVFTTPTLEGVLQIASEAVGPNVRRSELARILELVLTDYVPSALVQYEGGMDEPDRAFTPDQEITMQDVMDELAILAGDTLTVLALKIADHSDTTVAKYFDISRPTAAKRFKEASMQVGAAIAELPPNMQDEILTRFADRLLAGHLPHLETSGEPR